MHAMDLYKNGVCRYQLILPSFVVIDYCMAVVLITGGTGLIGDALSAHLVQLGHQVIIVTRYIGSKQPREGISYVEWDIRKGTIDKKSISKASHIVHLAGANVAEKRWISKRKQEIVYSRVQSGALLVNALREIPNQVQSVVSASAIGWYGPDSQIPNTKPFVETDPSSDDFLGTTCAAWEAAIAPVSDLGKRLVYLRTGIVLSKEGGAFKEFVKPLKFGAATVLGSGKQIISWIHIDDLVRLYTSALFDASWNGVYNAVAPNPVSNKKLISTIAETSGRFYVKVPVPSLALSLALGQMSIEVLKSTTVSAAKVSDKQFEFNFPDVESAVQDLMK
jgi:uncharacterized protein